MNSQSNDKTTVQAIFKGTAFPMCMSITSQKWREFSNACDQLIQQATKCGVNEANRARVCLQNLTSIENEMRIMCGGVGQQYKPNQDDLKQLLERVNTAREMLVGLKTPEMLMNLWYQGVYTLLKLSTIQNDNMNGWMFMSENAAFALAYDPSKREKPKTGKVAMKSER